MISELPDNLIEDGRWYEEEAPIVERSRRPRRAPAQKKPAPELKRRPSPFGSAYDKVIAMEEKSSGM